MLSRHRQTQIGIHFASSVTFCATRLEAVIRFFRHMSRFECEIVRLTKARTVASPFTVSGATILAQRDKSGFLRRKSVIGPEHRELLTRPAFFCGSVVNFFVLSKCETGEEDY